MSKILDHLEEPKGVHFIVLTNTGLVFLMLFSQQLLKEYVIDKYIASDQLSSNLNLVVGILVMYVIFSSIKKMLRKINRLKPKASEKIVAVYGAVIMLFGALGYAFFYNAIVKAHGFDLNYHNIFGGSLFLSFFGFLYAYWMIHEIREIENPTPGRLFYLMLLLAAIICYFNPNFLG